MEEKEANWEKATLGAGCFWCVEAVFQRLEGVEDAVSGYMGGSIENPTYEAVCSGSTGHAEVVQITFDRSKISYEEILDVFWRSHDPTTLNRQGADTGTQYRSSIFYHSDEQKNLATSSREIQDASGNFSNPIVTEISPAETFYPAEDYHQEFFERNPHHRYCQLVISPKLSKLEESD